jgi:hypothetical protein
MAWRAARSLDVLLVQLNVMAPNRSKISDGAIGDTAHSARKSDHNPDAQNIVRARDYTHDPAGGLDCHWLAAQLAASRDPRIKYVIWDRRIWQGSWKPYSGSSPHIKHLHLSVVAGPAADDTTAWNLGLPASGGFLMSLSDAEQRFVHDRIAGMLPQRYYVTVDSGIAVEVAKDHPGAKAATVLDTLDGDFLRRLIDAKATEPAPVELSDAQLELLADKVAARLNSLRFVANPEGSTT